MKWNDHSSLVGLHAFLGASKHSWLRYDQSKLRQVYISERAKERGTELHALACDCIRLGVKLPRSKQTLCMYVNDAIGFRMTPEQVLYVNPKCFGTADSISFEKNFLRIHDLKTGSTPASMEQLYIYAAMFCLEYMVKPGEIEMETRIYQNDSIVISNPTADDILPIMDLIEIDTRILNEIDEGE